MGAHPVGTTGQHAAGDRPQLSKSDGGACASTCALTTRVDAVTTTTQTTSHSPNWSTVRRRRGEIHSAVATVTTARAITP